ncbi:hypothetical protein MHYP_G00350390 [Metynnis hypsauchen]
MIGSLLYLRPLSRRQAGLKRLTQTKAPRSEPSGKVLQRLRTAPKRQVPAQELHDERDCDKHENLPSTSDEAVCSTAGSVDKVCAMLQTFMREQHLKNELWRHEVEKQEQRWRSIQHQFNLLQEQVHGTQREDRPTRGTEDEYSEEETQRLLQTRTLRRTPAHDATAR